MTSRRFVMCNLLECENFFLSLSLLRNLSLFKMPFDIRPKSERVQGISKAFTIIDEREWSVNAGNGHEAHHLIAVFRRSLIYESLSSLHHKAINFRVSRICDRHKHQILCTKHVFSRICSVSKTNSSNICVTSALKMLKNFTATKCDSIIKSFHH